MEYTLIKKILSSSESNNWEEAKKEWDIIYSYIAQYYEQCLCGHYPIKEVIVIKNKINHNSAKIGNCCINKFFEIKDYNKFFKAIHKNKINKMIIELASDKYVINEWEKEFLLNVWRKRNMSQKQSRIFNNLKDRIIIYFKQEVKEDDTTKIK